MGWAAIGRFGGIGDNLICSSVLPGLKKKYGNLEVLTQLPQGVVYENNPYVDKLTIRPLDTLPSDGVEWHKWFDDRAKEYDFFVNLSTTCEGRLAFLRHQTEFYWPESARRMLANKNYLEFVHDVCGLPYEFAPAFYSTDDEKNKAVEINNRINPEKKAVVGWCLAGTRLDKLYPYSAMVITRLIRELDCCVVMFGQPGQDYDMAEAILKYVERENSTHEGLHLALSPVGGDAPDPPLWPIRKGLSQILTCDLVIGPDTGPMWAVAMSDMPKIALLSHASPVNITKHWKNAVALHADPQRVSCWPCHRLHDTPDTCRPNADKNGAACMSDIPVERIIRLASIMLNKKGKPDVRKSDRSCADQCTSDYQEPSGNCSDSHAEAGAALPFIPERY